MKKPKLKNSPSLAKQSEPYLLLENDPSYRKPRTSSNRSNTTKHLTISKRKRTLKSVIKLKRKDDKMAHDKTKIKGNLIKSFAWLLFATQQAFIGYVLLTNFDNYFVIVSALVSLGIAGVIVAVHFFKAHK